MIDNYVVPYIERENDIYVQLIESVHSNIYMGHVLNMNKWSKSLPSIIALSNDKKLSTLHDDDDDDDDSLTDVSLIIETKPSSRNYGQVSKYYNASIKHKPTIQTDISIDDQLFQSLIAYANSFNLDKTVYSKQDIKTQLDSTSSIKQTLSKQQIQSLSIENNRLIRHKSCENLIQQDSTELIPSHFFSSRKTEDSNSDKYNDESTTVTDGSKFEWEYLSDTMDHSNKSSKELFKDYETPTNINEINIDYLQDLKKFSEKNFSQKIPPSPIIIREKIKDLFIQQNLNIQFFHPPTPIIVREILHKPSPPNQTISKYHLPSSSTSKPPMIPKPKIIYERILPTQGKRPIDKQSNKIIIEYDQINVTVDKNIQQRKGIKRVNPNEYVQQHGSSLYSKEAFHNLLTNIIA